MDLGIKAFAFTSDGEKIPSPRKLARRACALARYQRRLARCQKGSANRVKAKAKVARAHRKVRASRTDFLHRASARLVRDHDVLVVEDLAVRDMTRRPAPRPDPDRPGAYLPNGAAANVAVVALASILIGTVFGALSNTIGMLVRQWEAIIGINVFFMLPLTFLSSAFLPTTLMPGWMRAIAACNPLNWAVQAGRDALNASADCPRWPSAGPACWPWPWCA